MRRPTDDHFIVFTEVPDHEAPTLWELFLFTVLGIVAFCGIFYPLTPSGKSSTGNMSL